MANEKGLDEEPIYVCRIPKQASSYRGSLNAHPVKVEFEKDDPRDPFNWSASKKWLITIVGCAYTGFVSSAASAYPVGYPSMTRDLNCTVLQASAGLTTYIGGFGVAPLVLASFSEEFGRRPMYLVTCAFFCIFFLPIALAQNIATVIICKFIQGSAASTGATMVGGTLADMWRTADRGVPMNLYAAAALFSVGLGPVIAGWIENNRNLEWRWINLAILLSTSGAYWLVLYFFMEETRGSVLLIRQVHLLRKESGDNRYRPRIEDERPSLRELIWISCTRPIWLLITEPVVLSFSIWIGFVWGVLFALIESVGLVFGTLYPQFNPGQLGAVFATVSIGSLIGFITVATRGPEARLYFACIGGILIVIGAIIYAWTTIEHRSNIPWIAPCIGITVFIVGLFHVYLAVFNYLADAYLIYASSALSGQSFLRNIMAAAFPLFTRQMYRKLTFPWASMLFALISLLLCLCPFILIIWGSEIRARSRFAKRLAASHTNH
ncbi:hypothetical protein BS47DRAFT_1290479 [Hydnum rufescens UP504]|uniref:Major facilitator superfamily (MFS) profile domain-containing protein n=1 Tax=Hydnum rufescens UP504 TaxID=1448309 RepID=A0A9P6B511_9AGAM|nr:hypothetical protein BS47DRAFT_1290479 [Hydnum rufescens UP504]